VKNYDSYIDCFERVKDILSKRKVSLDETHFVVVEDGVTSAVERLLFSSLNNNGALSNGAFDVEVVSFARLFFKLKERFEVWEGRVLDIVPLGRSGAIMLLKKVVFENIDKVKVFSRSVKFSGFFEVLYDTIVELSMHNAKLSMQSSYGNEDGNKFAGATIDCLLLVAEKDRGRPIVNSKNKKHSDNVKIKNNFNNNSALNNSGALKTSTDFKLNEIQAISELFFAECDKHKYVDRAGQMKLLCEIIPKLDLKNDHFYFVGIDKLTVVEKEIVELISMQKFACNMQNSCESEKGSKMVGADIDCLQGGLGTDGGRIMTTLESVLKSKTKPNNNCVLILTKASDEHELIKNIASRIRHNIINGMKFSDMAVIAQDSSHDRIKRIFSEYDIAFHLDEKLILGEQEIARQLLESEEWKIRNEELKIKDGNNENNLTASSLSIKTLVEKILVQINAEKRLEELTKLTQIDLMQVPRKMIEVAEQCEKITNNFGMQKKIFVEGILSQKISFIPKLVDVVEIGSVDKFLAKRYKEIFVLNFLEEVFFKSKKDFALSNKDFKKLGIEVDDVKNIEMEEARLERVLLQNEGVFFTVLENGLDDEPFVKELLLKDDVECRVQISCDIEEMISHESRGIEVALLSETAVKEGEKGVSFHQDLVNALGGKVEMFRDRVGDRFLINSGGSNNLTISSFSTLNSQLSKSISSSRLETYFSCPLKAFLKYSLDLKKIEKNEIQPYETGNFLHEVVERVFSSIAWKDNEIEESVRKICGEILERDERLQKILKDGQIERLTNEAVRLSKILINQVQKGSFVPKYFEKHLKEFETKLEFSIENGSMQKFECRMQNNCGYEDNNKLVEATNGRPLLDTEQNNGRLLVAPASDIFKNKKNSDNNCALNKTPLKGIIDRIDFFNNPKDGKTYARIIDYKTGRREGSKFSFKDLYYGKKVQLTLYAKVLIENGYNIAGLFYFPLNAGVFNEDETDFRLEGVYLKDGDILNAHDIALSVPLSTSSVLAGAATKKDGDLDGRKRPKAFTQEELKKIIDYSFYVCKKALDEMNEGRFEVKPLKEECSRCDYSSICLGVEKKEREMSFGESDIKKFLVNS